MEKIYNSLAQRAADLHGLKQQRIVIAIAGVPGSGKTTLAAEVAKRLDNAMVVPMDGYHYPRSVLDKMEDPAEAHERRGAPFTFDAPGVVKLVQDLKTGEPVWAPTFDHAVKDPVANGLEIKSSVQIVLLEGLYLLLKQDPWSQIADLVDEKWMVRVDPDVASERVAKRHVAAGICSTLELGFERANGNDRTNGVLVGNESVQADVTVDSDTNHPSLDSLSSKNNGSW